MTSPNPPSLETRLDAMDIQDSTSSTKALPRLLQLPRELRDQIYRSFVPTSRSWTPLCILVRGSAMNLDSEDNRDIRRRISPKAIPFLYTCRQILHEASVLFYKENYFDFVPKSGHYLPCAFEQKSLLRTTLNIKRIKHLRLVFGVGQLDPEQDKAREEKVKQGKAELVNMPSAQEQCALDKYRWLMVSDIPKILQAFIDQKVSVATLSLNFQFAYWIQSDNYQKALCDEMNTNCDLLKTLHDLGVRGQITIRARCFPEKLVIYRPISAYARRLAEWGGYSITRAQHFEFGEHKFVWYVRPEENEDKIAQIRKSLKEGKGVRMITYCIQEG